MASIFRSVYILLLQCEHSKIISHSAVSHEKFHGIPIASLPVIDYDKLLSGNDAEVLRLVGICKSLGFFYLDLSGMGKPYMIEHLTTRADCLNI